MKTFVTDISAERVGVFLARRSVQHLGVDNLQFIDNL
jgi:hypothetical protein